MDYGRLVYPLDLVACADIQVHTPAKVHSRELDVHLLMMRIEVLGVVEGEDLRSGYELEDHGSRGVGHPTIVSQVDSDGFFVCKAWNRAANMR